MSDKMQYKGTSDIAAEYCNVFKEMHGKCLYIGCGSGNIVKNVILPKLPSDATVIGTETSGDTLECARKKFANEKRINFSYLDINAMIMDEKQVEYYNNVVSFYYLHKFQNLTRIFRNMARLLQKGGQGFVVFFSHHNLYDFFLSYRTDPKFNPYMEDSYYQLAPLYGLPNAADIVKHELLCSSLEPIECKSREITFVHQNLDDLKSFLITTDPFVNRMPDNIKKLYLDEISQDLQSTIIKEGIADTYRVVIAQFKKS